MLRRAAETTWGRGALLVSDPRLPAISGVRSVVAAVALSLFDAPRPAELERRLVAGAGDR